MYVCLQSIDQRIVQLITRAQTIVIVCLPAIDQQLVQLITRAQTILIACLPLSQADVNLKFSESVQSSQAGQDNYKAKPEIKVRFTIFSYFSGRSFEDFDAPFMKRCFLMQFGTSFVWTHCIEVLIILNFCLIWNIQAATYMYIIIVYVVWTL